LGRTFCSIAWAKVAPARSSRPGTRRWAGIVALKLIHKELLSDPEVVSRFYREIEVLSRLDHPAVNRGGVRGHYLALEYVEGTDLAKLVKQRGPLPLAQACE
jgi:serine/threonine protein kinase